MLSEMKNEKCQTCGQKGFEGRDDILVEEGVSEDNGLCKLTYWTWTCKFCGVKNKVLFERN